MKCVVKLTETAKEDLRNIAYYIAEQSKDKKLATDFVKELREKCKILESFPEIGAVPRDRILISNGYRFLAHKEYLIFYSYNNEENSVCVLAVFNSKRDYMKVIKKFI